MSYTLRQVQALLNDTELLLFKASRRDEIASLTPRELRSKITRARNLRDKFRDLYQRQTAAVQRDPAIKRKPAGGENLRTQKKADVFAEVLERFENQLTKAESKVAKSAAKKQTRHNAPGAPASKTNPKSAQTSRRSTGNASAKGQADIAMRGKTTRKKADVQRAQQNALAEGKKTVAARGQKSTRTSTAKTSSAAAKAAKTAKPAKAKTAAAASKKASGSATTKAKSSKVGSATKAQKPLRKNVSTASSAAARGALSTSHTARAARVNTLKESALKKKVHASARSRNARYQAKKDSR
ncbi:MAG: hypothetical protein Q4A28_03040 [Brachymonas sp.]|nr:hypothetical protein [Brachymonas sp.]